MDSVESDWKISTVENEYISEHINTARDRKWEGDFYFVLGADPQFGCQDSFKNPNYDPLNPNWDFEINLAKLAVEKVNKMDPKPKFFVICGDLINEYPTGSWTTRSKQIRDFKKVFGQLRSDIPLVCVCGNHDIGLKPTVDFIQKYRSDFGCDYFSFWCGGILFIVLNSQYYMDSENVRNYAAMQDAWLDSLLEKAKGKRIVCFSHIPWFIEDLEEEHTMYNIPVEIRKRQLEKLYQAGVRYAFCGHLHTNRVSFYKDLEIVASSAIGAQFGPDVSGFRVVEVSMNKINHEYIGIENDSEMNLCP